MNIPYNHSVEERPSRVQSFTEYQFLHDDTQ